MAAARSWPVRSLRAIHDAAERKKSEKMQRLGTHQHRVSPKCTCTRSCTCTRGRLNTRAYLGVCNPNHFLKMPYIWATSQWNSGRVQARCYYGCPYVIQPGALDFNLYRHHLQRHHPNGFNWRHVYQHWNQLPIVWMRNPSGNFHQGWVLDENDNPNWGIRQRRRANQRFHNQMFNIQGPR